MKEQRAKSKEQRATDTAEQKAEGKYCLHYAEPRFRKSLRSRIKEQPTLRSKKQRASIACTMPSRDSGKACEAGLKSKEQPTLQKRNPPKVQKNFRGYFTI